MPKLNNLADQDIVNPIDSTWSQAEKIIRLQELSQENEPKITQLLKEIDRKYGTHSQTSYKTPAAIAEKACRKSIRDQKPWHDVEHIRDSFRFKTVLTNLEVLSDIAVDLRNAGIEVIKIDTAKVLAPGAWGWRIAVFDLQMPNGQLVEYYLPVRELEQAKKDGNHELFAKWRNADVDRLSEGEMADYINDLDDSHDKYQRAWQSYLRRTQQSSESVKAVLDETEQVFASS